MNVIRLAPNSGMAGTFLQVVLGHGQVCPAVMALVGLLVVARGGILDTATTTKKSNIKTLRSSGGFLFSLIS